MITIPCRCGQCEQPGDYRDGYARLCWRRWAYRNHPDVLPPKDNRGRQDPEIRASRMGEFMRLRERAGASVETAAARVGIHPRTGWRYERERKAGLAAAGPWAMQRPRSVRCPSCRTPSPDLPDPDSVLTWAATHSCRAVPGGTPDRPRRAS